jgi:hypothetical protein
MNYLAAIPYVGRQYRRLLLEGIPQRLEVDLRFAAQHELQDLVLLGYVRPNPFLHAVWIQEIRAPNTGALTSILVRGPDPATRSANFFRPSRALTRLVDRDVIIENEMGIAVDHDSPWRGISSSRSYSLHLGDQNRGVQNNARS